MWFIRTLHQVDHPACTHMSTSVQVHLQYITFTSLVLYLKVLGEKILKVSNDQWNPILFDIFKHSCLDFLPVEYLVLNNKGCVQFAWSITDLLLEEQHISRQTEIGLKQGGQRVKKDLTGNSCEDWVCLAQRRWESWTAGGRKWCQQCP